MKKYLFGAGAVALALAFSLNVNAKRAPLDWHFDPSLGLAATNPAAYVLGSISCDGVDDIVCTIKAEKSGTQPVFAAGTNPVTNPAMYQTQYRSN